MDIICTVTNSTIKNNTVRCATTKRPRTHAPSFHTNMSALRAQLLSQLQQEDQHFTPFSEHVARPETLAVDMPIEVAVQFESSWQPLQDETYTLLVVVPKKKPAGKD